MVRLGEFPRFPFRASGKAFPHPPSQAPRREMADMSCAPQSLFAAIPGAVEVCFDHVFPFDGA